MSNQTNALGTESIKKLLIKLAIPAILAQIINALYNIVDRIYIGNMPNAGHLALTGMGLTFPIVMLIAAFSVLIGFGAGPLLSIALGKKQEEEAQKILGTSLCCLVMLAVLLTIAFLVCKKPFLYMFGASDDTFIYADEYITIYILGTIFVMLVMGLNPSINAQGFSKIAMKIVIIGAVINIVLDPIFIFILNMGVRGAAIATLIAQAVSTLLIIRFLFSKKATVRLKIQYVKMDFRIIKNIVELGVSPFVMQATESLVLVCLNSQLAKYGNDFYIGSVTIISSVAQLMFMPLQGLMQGAQPIISYNYGAKQFERVRKTFKLAFIGGGGYIFIAWALVMIFPNAFIGIFSQDETLVATAVPVMRIYMSMIFVMGLQMPCQQTFIALGQAKISLLVACLRKIVLLVPLIFILPLFTGVDGIFLAEPISDTVSATTAVTLFIIFYKKHLSPKTIGDGKSEIE